MRKALAALAIVAAPVGVQAAGLDITVAGEANGTISVDLFEEVAPLHVERITTLAGEGAYDGVVFHRVIEGFMAQTGDVQFGKAGEDTSRAGMGGSGFARPASRVFERVVVRAWRDWHGAVAEPELGPTASSLSCLSPVRFWTDNTPSSAKSRLVWKPSTRSNWAKARTGRFWASLTEMVTVAVTE